VLSVDVLGVTETLATVGVVMTSVLLPATPSTVAVTETVPPPSAVTRPDAETDASAGLETLHVAVRPLIAFPSASAGVAVAWVVLPTMMLDDANDTLTVDTVAGDTLRVAVPLTPSTVPTMSVVPAATAVTTPSEDTVATEAFLLVHTTLRPVRTVPSESFAVAMPCVVCPACRLYEFSATTTEAITAGTTEILVIPEAPSTLALIVVLPSFLPATIPSLETVAMEVSELVQLAVRFCVAPLESRMIVES
jgi:hypothetical protein